MHTFFGSTVGQVFEISLNQDKELRVDKVYCVIDCGKTVQPDNIVNQMQGSIIIGLAAAFYGEITLKEGKIVQSNFPNYMMPKMAHSPQVEVHIMQNQEEPGGVGEPAVPPVLAALANAIFAVSGERVRTMPLKNLGYTFV